MKPVLFQLGPFPVSSFGVFLLLAFVAGILVLRARTGRFGWDPGEVLDLSLYAIIGGVVGARIGYVLVNLRDFAGDPMRVVTIWKDAGLTFYGALAGGALVAWLYSRRRGWSLGQLADAAAPGLAVGYAIAMIGTLLYGLNYGRPASVPWAVTLFGEARHPTQLYLLAMALIVFGLLRWAERRPHAPGALLWAFLFLYAAGRAIVEVWMDSPRVLGPLTLAQAVSILVALASALVWTRRSRPGAAAPDLAVGAAGRPDRGEELRALADRHAGPPTDAPAQAGAGEPRD